MTTTALVAMGAAAVIGVLVGMIVQHRRLQWALQRETAAWHAERAEHDEARAVLERELDTAQRRLADRTAAIEKLEWKVKEQRRNSRKLEAKVLDREATISSLRSRLYGARRSITILEDELAGSGRSDHVTAEHAIRVSVDLSQAGGPDEESVSAERG